MYYMFWTIWRFLMGLEFRTRFMLWCYVYIHVCVVFSPVWKELRRVSAGESFLLFFFVFFFPHPPKKKKNRLPFFAVDGIYIYFFLLWCTHKKKEPPSHLFHKTAQFFFSSFFIIYILFRFIFLQPVRPFIWDEVWVVHFLLKIAVDSLSLGSKSLPY